MGRCLGKGIQARGMASMKPGGRDVPGLWDSTIEVADNDGTVQMRAGSRNRTASAVAKSWGIEGSRYI